MPKIHASFNGARDYSQDTQQRADADQIRKPASMEPGITPGIHGGGVGVLQVGDLASMEPGIIPGIHDDAVLTQLRDHGLQWSSGLLPGYTVFQVTPVQLSAPSMEPGITPGIHSGLTQAEVSDKTLQWSPGSLPGYTLGNKPQFPATYASMEPGITPGIHMACICMRMTI